MLLVLLALGVLLVLLKLGTVRLMLLLLLMRLGLVEVVRVHVREGVEVFVDVEMVIPVIRRLWSVFLGVTERGRGGGRGAEAGRGGAE